MNLAPTPAPRRHVWRWVLIGAGLCLAPIILLAIVALSYLIPDRDVRVLRHHVMAATDATWSTKVQLSVGRVTLGAIGQGLRFVDHRDMADARLALRAVKQASVGVYEQTGGETGWSREQLFVETDRAMEKRGWTRLVGVAEKKEAVLVYVPDNIPADGPIKICLAVVDGREMVVVSTSVDPEIIGQIVALHTGDDFKRRLRFAQFKF